MSELRFLDWLARYTSAAAQSDRAPMPAALRDCRSHDESYDDFYPTT